MSSTVLCAVILLVCALTCTAAQAGCNGRCGAEYYRGSMCQCDYNCLSYGECCKDFESQCTTKNSCKGRCGESFKRGRLCSCDSDCSKFKQCCSDHKLHCDAEEPTLNEATEPSLFTEGNDEDMNSQMFPNDEFTNVEVEDPEDSPIPESTSDYGGSTADPLDPIPTEPIPTEPIPIDPISTDPISTDPIPTDPIPTDPIPTDPIPTDPIPTDPIPTDPISTDPNPTEPIPTDPIPTDPIQDPDTLEFGTETFTVFPQTQTTISDNKPTQADDDPSTIAIDPTSSSDPGTTLPQPTTAADHVSNQSTPTSVPQTEFSPTANTPELETAKEQLEDDILSVDPTAGPSDEPEVTTQSETASTGPTQASSTVPESSQVTTIPASTLDQTPIPEATTSNEPNVTTGPPSSPADPEGNGDLPELDALTTHIPSSTDAVQPDTTVTPGITTAHPLNVTPDPTKPAPSQVTSKPQDQPDPYKPTPTKPTVVKPSSKPETKPLNTGHPRDYQADDSNDTNLCSGRPVGAVTTLRNGTMVVFRGHYFWLLDKYMVPGPARGITHVWGVPSPIDTAFTRCNCQGKTYIFKGSQYWRFENDALDDNYPKAIEAGFGGLRGQITAALSVPQFQRRRESVYFFKRGGSVQKYSYQFGNSPTCGRKVQHAVYTFRNRMVRQAVSFLEPVVNIRTSWRGFPSTITAAVSVPSIRTPERYKYYVFSRSISYNVRMDSGHPIVPVPKGNASPQSNDFLKCSERV